MFLLLLCYSFTVKSQETTVAGEDVEKQEHFYIVGGIVNQFNHCGRLWQFLKDPEPEIPFDPAIPFLGIQPKDYISFYYKDTCTCMFTAALFTIAKSGNQPKYPSMIDWIKKLWQIYTMEQYTAIKNDEFVSFIGTWMNLETIILSRQEEITKHHMFSLIGGC